MFNVGQKVVCIRSGRPPNGETPPNLGDVYTVRDIVDHGHKVGIRLVEIKNPQMNYGGCGVMECTFSPDCFRPIVSRKTDISVFTALLNPTPQKVRESIGYDLGFTKEEIGLS